MQVHPGELGLADASVFGERLLGLPVRVRGIQLGWTVDLLLDPKRSRLVGLDVSCGDEQRRFLPFSTAILAGEELLVPSALVLVDDEDAAFYRKRSVRFSALRGLPVEQDKRLLGLLHDVVLDRDGAVTTLVVDANGGRLDVPCTGFLELGAGILRC